MLIITRRAGERIMVGDDVVVEIMEIVGNSVRVGISAPRSVPVYREEIWPPCATRTAPPPRPPRSSFPVAPLSTAAPGATPPGYASWHGLRQDRRNVGVAESRSPSRATDRAHLPACSHEAKFGKAALLMGAPPPRPPACCSSATRSRPARPGRCDASRPELDAGLPPPPAVQLRRARPGREHRDPRPGARRAASRRPAGSTRRPRRPPPRPRPPTSAARSPTTPAPRARRGRRRGRAPAGGGRRGQAEGQEQAEAELRRRRRARRRHERLRAARSTTRSRSSPPARSGRDAGAGHPRRGRRLATGRAARRAGDGRRAADIAVKVLGEGGLPSHDARRWQSGPHLPALARALRGPALPRARPGVRDVPLTRLAGALRDPSGPAAVPRQAQGASRARAVGARRASSTSGSPRTPASTSVLNSEDPARRGRRDPRPRAAGRADGRDGPRARGGGRPARRRRGRATRSAASRPASSALERARRPGW